MLRAFAALLRQREQASVPVAWRCKAPNGSRGITDDAELVDMWESHGWEVTALYEAPPASEQASVPDGWRLVPLDPPPDMLESAGTMDGWDGDEADADHINWWHMMVAAAPTAPAGDANVPDGYHYIYKDPLTGNEVIVKNGGGTWNGQKPIRAKPYFYAPGSDAERICQNCGRLKSQPLREK